MQLFSWLQALLQCNNNAQEAVQLLLPESPVDPSVLTSEYININSYKRIDSDDSWMKE